MRLRTIQNKIDYYKLFVPVNFQKEKDLFFESLSSGQAYNPIFKYKDNLSLKYLDELKNEIVAFKKNDPIINEFTKTYLLIIQLLISREKDDYVTLTKLSGILFGSYKKFNKTKLKKKYLELSKIKPAEKKYSSEELAKSLLDLLKKGGLIGWKVNFDSANPSEVSIYDLEKRIIVKPNLFFSEIDLNRILCHEIRGHAFQSLNASESQYSDLFTHYLGTELQYEGFAIFTELNNLPTSYISDIFARYILLVIATSAAISSSFHEVYQEIFSLTGDREFSFTAAYRSKRGFRDTSKKGAFQKENSYLLGALEIIHLIKKNPDNYQRLSKGSFPFSLIYKISLESNKWNSIKKMNIYNQSKFLSIFSEITN